MKLNSNRKNVAKIVAAASSAVVFSCASTYQLNGVVEGDVLAMDFVRDGLKSNMGLGTLKKWFTPVKRGAIVLKNMAASAVRAPFHFLQFCVKPVLRCLVKCSDPFQQQFENPPLDKISIVFPKKVVDETRIVWAKKGEQTGMFQHDADSSQKRESPKVKLLVTSSHSPMMMLSHLKGMLGHKGGHPDYADMSPELRKSHAEQFLSSGDLLPFLTTGELRGLVEDTIAQKEAGDVAFLLKSLGSTFPYLFEIKGELKQIIDRSNSIQKKAKWYSSCLLFVMGAVEKAAAKSTDVRVDDRFHGILDVVLENTGSEQDVINNARYWGEEYFFAKLDKSQRDKFLEQISLAYAHLKA